MVDTVSCQLAKHQSSNIFVLLEAKIVDRLVTDRVAVIKRACVPFGSPLLIKQ